MTSTSTPKKMQRFLLPIFTFMLLFGMVLTPDVAAQGQGQHYATRTIQKQIPQANFKVVGQMPAQAQVQATKVQRTLPQGKQVKGAYDITIRNGNAEWQPLQGQPVMVSITDPDFADGELLDVYHEGANGNEFVATVSPTNHTITFPAQSFSVYIVTEADHTGENARLKVCFHQNSTDAPVIIYVKKADDTPEHFETVLYDPGVGTLASGVSFRGWSTNPNYTKTDIPNGKTIADIRTEVQALLNDAANPIVEGQSEVHYYAMLFKSYIVSYYDGSPATLGSHDVTFRADATQTAYPYTVNMAYTPTSSTYNFQGWIAESSDNIQNAHDPNLYQNGDEITITGSVKFDVKQAEGHWLIFDENGKGATYIAPQFVESGAAPDEPTLPMTRVGYTFGGWYTGAPSEPGGTPTGSPFNFDNELTGMTTIYAKWTAASQANYTIIIWKQKLTDQSDPNDPNADYDFERSVLVQNGAVGQVVPANMVQGNGSSATVNGTSYSWTGFHYARTDRADVTVTPEGTAVVNVYFDRDEITFNFYTWRDGYTEYVYTATTNYNDGDYYIDEDGDGQYEAVHLYRNDNTWYRDRQCALWILVCISYNYSNPYYGTVYTRTQVNHGSAWDIYKTMTGRYGSTLADNGEVWPEEYDWYSSQGSNGTPTGTHTTFLDAFLPASTQTTVNFYGRSPQGNNHVYFYKQNPNGNGYTLANTVNVTGTGFNLSDKYYGFKCVAWNTTNNTSNWNLVGELMNQNGDLYYDANPNQSGYQTASFNNNLYVYFDCEKYDFVYDNGSTYTGNNTTDQQGNTVYGSFEQRYITLNPIRTVEDVAFGTNLNIASYKDYVPAESTWPEGYVFEGWYADDHCSTPYNFTTMPSNNVRVYAKWRQIRFRAFLHPNALNDDGTRDNTLSWGSGSQQMNFSVAWGGHVSVPDGRRDGYEFVGWFTDENFEHPFNEDAFVLNNTTVPATPVYHKTGDNIDYTDEMDKWGLITNEGSGAYNSDADRPWVQRKLDIYAQWRAVVEGAIGIVVEYDANGGTQAPSDENKYLDAAKATAGAASKAPTGKVFSHWVVQQFNCTSGQFEDGDVTVYPGAEFIIHRSDARIIVSQWQNPTQGQETDIISVQNPTPCNTTAPDNTHTKIYNATYTIRLKAVYKDVEEPTLTHIVWYKNYSSDTPTYRVDDDININQAVVIYGKGQGEAIPSRDGYTFKGWYKLKVEDEEDVEFTLADYELPSDSNICVPNFIDYNNNLYYAAGTTNQADSVAADEANPYDYLYAIWAPIVDFNFSPVCQGQEMTLPMTTKDGVALTGTWTASAGTVDGTTYTAPDQGGEVTLTFTPDASTCAEVTAFTVTVNANPTVTLTDVTICSGDDVTLTPTGLSDDINLYTWVENPESEEDIEEGTPQPYTQQNVTEDFTKTITVANDNGCVASATAQVTVNALPTVTLSGTKVCAGEIAQVIPTVTGATHYKWDNESTWTEWPASAPVKERTEVGTESHTMTVKAQYGDLACEVTSDPVTMTVVAKPQVTLTGVSACDGDQATITPALATGSATPTHYKWSTDNDWSEWTEAPEAKTYSVTGTYTESMSVKIQDGDLSCATTSDEVTVNVFPNPTVVLTPADACFGNNATITPSIPQGAPTPTHYRWSTDDEGVWTEWTGVPAAKTYTEPNTYSAGMSVKVQHGETLACEYTAQPVEVTVNPRSDVVVNGSDFCEDAAAADRTLTVSLPQGATASLDGATYKWNDNSTESTLVVSATGTYSVTVTFQGGCEAEGFVTVTKNLKPVVNITSQQPFCYGADAVFTANANPGTGETYSYAWSGNPAGTASGNTYTVSNAQASGTVTVTVTETALGTNCSTTTEAYAYTVYGQLVPGEIEYQTTVCHDNDTIRTITNTTLASGGDNGHYVWQYSNDGQTWNDVVDANNQVVSSAQYTIPASYHTSYRRAWVTESCGTVYTNVVYVIYAGQVDPGTLTGTTNYCEGESVNQQIEAGTVSVESNAPYTLQWQSSSDGQDNTWTNITGASISYDPTSTTTPDFSYTYTNTGITDDIYFRYVITIDGCDPIPSNGNVHLKVYHKPTITFNDYNVFCASTVLKDIQANINVPADAYTLTWTYRGATTTTQTIPATTTTAIYQADIDPDGVACWGVYPLSVVYNDGVCTTDAVVCTLYVDINQNWTDDLPTNQTVNVDCISQVQQPTLATVKDKCQNDVVPVLVTTAESIATQIAEATCGGEVVYEFQYTDCRNHAETRTYKYIVAEPVLTVPETLAAVQNVNACYATGVAENHFMTDADVKALCSSTCNKEVAVTHDAAEDVVANGSDNCGWTVTRTYHITNDCTTETKTQSVSGGDKTAPALRNGETFPTLQSQNACFADADTTGLLDASEVKAMYEDCGEFTVEVSDAPTSSSDCSGWTWTRTYTITDVCDNATTATMSVSGKDDSAPVITGTLPELTAIGCSAAVKPDAYATATELKDALEDAQDGTSANITDNCTGLAQLEVLVSDVSDETDSCNITVTRTYKVKDLCGKVSNEVTQLIKVKHNAIPQIVTQASASASTVDCSTDVKAPHEVADFTMPVVKDQCGNVIPTPTPTQSNNYDACNQGGDFTYTYVYKDCTDESLTVTWTYTYHVSPITVVLKDPNNTITDIEDIDGCYSASYADQLKTDGEVWNMYATSCPDVSTLSVTHGDDVIVDNNCGWSITRTFTISTIYNGNTCTSITETQKISGSDRTAPVQANNAQWPANITGQDKCLLSADTTGLKDDSEIKGLFADCSAITVTHEDLLSEDADNCAWTWTRTYTIKDACNNTYYLDDNETLPTMSVSGGDQTVPVISGTIPAQTATPAQNCQYEIPDVTGLVRNISSDNCTAQAALTITQEPQAGTSYSQEEYGGEQISVTVTVKDACGKQSTTTVDVTIPAIFEIIGFTKQPETCAGNDGTALVNVDIEGSYTYVWSNQQTGPQATGLTKFGPVNMTTVPPTQSTTPISYSVTVTDGNGCSQNASTSIDQTNTLVIHHITTPTTICSGDEFSITPQDGVNEDVIPAGTAYFTWPAPSAYDQCIDSESEGLQPKANQESIHGTLISNCQDPSQVTYNVVPVNGVCVGSQFTAVVTVNPIPTISANPATATAQNIPYGNAIAPVTITNNTTASTVTVTGLPGGVTYSNGVISGTPTAVGNYTITATANSVYTDVTCDPESVTIQINVTANTTALKIESADGEWTYDGAEHTKYEYTVTYGNEDPQTVTIAEGASTATVTLSTGDVVTITPAADAKITHVAETTVDNSFSYTITNAAGTDVAGQYTNKSKAEGELTITPKAVTVTAASEEFTYDGTAHSNANYTVEGLVGSDAISAVVTGSITYPSESPVTNVLTSYEFTAGTPGNYTV
ncbi:MAG: InlB B-repeat-containing protein, partial [Bacteroidales bacterium]|nr:InlB B-repeat-containing protein [Bacteroidales bacterium]